MARRSDFTDFEIELRSGQGGFEARVLSAPFGRVAAPFVPPFADGRLQEILGALERRVRAGVRRDLEEEDGGEDRQAPASDPKGVGRSLFEALFPAPVERGFREALASLEARGAPGLRLRLTFDRREDFALLATLPWELLFDGQQFLALHRMTPIVRSHNQRTRPRAIGSGPLRVLLVDSRPSDLRALDTGHEAEAIRDAIERNPHIEIIHLPHPNVRNLRQRLLDEECHVLHFMGHGDFRAGQENDPVLWFESEHGQAEAVTGELLADFVNDMPKLRLAVLNSCWGGALPRRLGQDPFSGVAAALMARGIPAVVAMQFPITDGAAIAFGKAFYGRLAAGDSICEAVTEGRMEIMGRDQDSLEWATPAIFLAGTDRLFRVPPAGRRPATRSGGPGGGGRRAAQIEPVLLAVRSFRGFASTNGEAKAVLDLTGFFDGRHIRRHQDWQEEVFPRLREFLLEHAAARRPLVLDFAAHATLAFAAGYCLEAKSGLDITLLQRGLRGTLAWRAEAGPGKAGPLWIAGADQERATDVADAALAASVTWPILEDVEHYLETAGIAVGRLIPMTLYPQPSPRGVESGLHALELAQELAWKIRGRSVRERAAVLHLFSAAPNALLFYLGQLGRSLGAVQLYEHDFESGLPGAYRPSLRLPLPHPASAGA